MKRKLLKGIIALGIIGATFSFSNNTLAGIPSEHSPIKVNYVEPAGIPSEHSLIKAAGIPSEH